MNGLESGACGLSQDTVDLLPTTGLVVMSCDLLWPFCGF